MYIATCRVTLQLIGITSIKEKRAISKSLLARLRNSYNVSAAEVDAQDSHGRLVLGVAAVSGSGEYARGQIDAVLRWIEQERPDLPVIDYETELL